CTSPPPSAFAPFPLPAALPISADVTQRADCTARRGRPPPPARRRARAGPRAAPATAPPWRRRPSRGVPSTGRRRRRGRRARGPRSEEHTSELQSRENLVCRLLL